MSTQQLSQAAKGHVNGSGGRPLGFPALLEQMKPQIALALPKHLSADRMARIALTEWRKNRQLAECDVNSILGAIVTLSQLGLEPGVLGQGYLIPYKGQCQPIPGWKGLVDLVSRSGRATVHTGAVYVGDDFEYEMGSNPFIKHKPGDDGEQAPESLTHCYAVGWVKGAERPIIEVWSMRKILKHRDRYNKVGARHYSFQNQEMYGRKVVLLQVLKYMPASVELQQAMDISNMADTGQTISLQQAATGTWVPQDANVDTQTGEIVTADESKQEATKPAEQQKAEPPKTNGKKPAEQKAADPVESEKSLRAAKTVVALDGIWKAITEDNRSNELHAAYSETREQLMEGGEENAEPEL